MDIYLITIDDVYEYETFEHTPEAFLKVEDARVRYESLVEDIKQEMISCGNDDWEESQGVTFFEMWLEGEWGTSHYGIYLQKIKVTE